MYLVKLVIKEVCVGAISPTSFAFFDTKRNELGQKQFWKKVSFKDLKKSYMIVDFFNQNVKVSLVF